MFNRVGLSPRHKATASGDMLPRRQGVVLISPAVLAQSPVHTPTMLKAHAADAFRQRRRIGIPMRTEVYGYASSV
jgi:hypothetical protein